VGVVVEAAVVGHRLGQSRFTGMPERRMAEIMSERDRLGQRFVRLQRGRQATGNLGRFDSMRKSGTEVVVVRRSKDLSFSFQPPEGGARYDAMAVELERSAERVGRFGVGSAARAARTRRIGRETGF
jgi:hypothetical protein